MFGALLECLLDGCELDRGMVLRMEGGEARAVAIRSSDRAEEMEPRPYSGTLLKAALASGGTIRLEENPEVEQAESLAVAGVRERGRAADAAAGVASATAAGHTVDTRNDALDTAATPTGPCS